jgi:Zn-dependent protease with chaperone function
MPKLIGQSVLFLLSTALCSLVFAQATLRDQGRERRVWQELEQIAPKAVPQFKAATEALDKDNNQEAVRLYREVLKQAPGFDAAERRLGGALISLGQKEEGLKLLQTVSARRPSYNNVFSYARALAYPGPNQTSSVADKQHALMLLQQVLPLADDSAALTLIAQLDLDLDRAADFRRISEQLSAKYPNEMQTHYFASLRAVMEEDWSKAEAELRQAQALGLPPDIAEQLLNAGIRSRAQTWRYAFWLGVLLVIWLIGLLALFGGGKLFSRLTLRSLENADPNVTASAHEISLRTWYKRLINFAGLYYYISLPVVIVLVIVAACAVVYGFWMIGFVPYKLVVILAIGALVTIYQSIRSLFIKLEHEDPGRALKAEEAPGLWALTREVAQAVGTRPIDEIRVTPGCEMAVYEKGKFRSKLHDEAKRILILGIATLNGMQQNALRAVLAHEYGHFSHRDTAGGEIALRVEQDMGKFAIAMALSGQAVWWNLAYQFLRLYHFIFSRLSYGATRLQEVLADRVAVRNYGAPAFEEGLRHVIRREVEFHRAATKEIDAASEQRRDITNLYQLPAAQDNTDERMIQDEINDIITRPTKEDDSHPSPIDRFRLASRINSTPQLPADAPVWELFADRRALTEEMSGQINQHVQEAIKEEAGKEEDGPKFTLLED